MKPKIITYTIQFTVAISLMCATFLIVHHHVQRAYGIQNLAGMSISSQNKTYPKELKLQVLKALGFFPELENIPIEFRFKKNIKRSTMQAQPNFKSLLGERKKRRYFIFMKRTFRLGEKEIPIEKLPFDVVVGWLGHELGHIMDYETRTKGQLVSFGYNYLTSDNHIIEAERTADRYAAEHGMIHYLLATKKYIVNNADLDPAYRERLKKYYLSPEELMMSIKK